MRLQQETYLDDNGRVIEASRVQVLAPYIPSSDGFYHWECGHCSTVRMDRSCGWPINGQVLTCQACGKRNLLVRTNCVDIDNALSGKWRQNEIAEENKHLTGIRDRNSQELNTLRARMVAAVSEAVRKIE